MNCWGRVFCERESVLVSVWAHQMFDFFFEKSRTTYTNHEPILKKNIYDKPKNSEVQSFPGDGWIFGGVASIFGQKNNPPKQEKGLDFSPKGVKKEVKMANIMEQYIARKLKEQDLPTKKKKKSSLTKKFRPRPLPIPEPTPIVIIFFLFLIPFF